MKREAELMTAQLEISIKWAEDNPAMFDYQIKEFVKLYSDQYIFSLTYRPGFVTLTANKEQQ